MKHLAALAAAAVLAAVPVPAAADGRAAAKQEVMAAPEVKDTLWVSDKIFYVGMLDNGRPRHGYAMYVCQVLWEHGVDRGTLVKIIDIASVVREGDFRELGRAWCDDVNRR